MIHFKVGLTTTYYLKIKFYLLALALVPVLAAAQATDMKPMPTDAVRNTAATPATPASKNIYIAGGNVRPAALVVGDLYALGGRVAVEQPVQGDATLAGGSVMVRAAIGDDLRIAGGDVNLESSVGGELVAFGGNIALGNTSTVAGAVTLYGDHVTIEGKITGPLKLYAQKVSLNGEVAGDVELNAREIELGSRAKLNAALRYPSDSLFKTAEGVIIGGAVTRGQAMNGRPDIHHNREWHGQMMGGGLGWAGMIVNMAVGFVAVLAGATLFLLIFTGFSRRASNKMLVTPWPALAAGLAVSLGTPMLAMLLLITLIGIPLGLVLMMVFPLVLLTGWIVGVFGIALKLQRAVQKEASSESSATMIGFFALALLLVLLIGSLPFIGSLIVVTILLLGTGACALELYRMVRSGSSLPEKGDSSPDASPHARMASAS
jgi:hypothetical protein